MKNFNLNPIYKYTPQKHDRDFASYQGEIHEDGGIYEEALAVDAQESFKVQQRLQDKQKRDQERSYATYYKNIKYSDRKFKRENGIELTFGEKFEDLAEKMIVPIGSLALRYVAPHATEFIDRLSARKDRIEYGKRKRKAEKANFNAFESLEGIENSAIKLQSKYQK